MTFFHSIILGVVEGFTEFLPISSTAHLILTAKLLGLAQTDFLKSFEVVIQFGAILAVVVLYFKKLLDLEIWKRLIVAFIPTGIIGLTLYPFIKQAFDEGLLITLALALGGVAIILFEIYHQEKEGSLDDIKKLSYPKLLAIGLFQSIAVIPGVSRAAATIIGGSWLGLSRRAIVEFSFLLAVPTMLAASGYDLLKNGSSFSADQIWLLLAGFVMSFLTAWLSIKFLLNFIRQHNFISFGIYRIAAAVIFFLVLACPVASSLCYWMQNI